MARSNSPKTAGPAGADVASGAARGRAVRRSAGAKRMGPPKGPRAENVAETREKLLRTAVAHFAQFGFDGARIEKICDDAALSPRMVYHYFVDKAGLYVATLERVLGQLRAQELALVTASQPPLEGLLTMFDFVFGHFSRHPELIRLLSAENLMHGRFLERSTDTPLVASPVIVQIRRLLDEGRRDGSVRAGIDSLHLYVTMVALSYFHRSNEYTLAIIFGRQLCAPEWQAEHGRIAREMLAAFLRPPAPE